MLWGLSALKLVLEIALLALAGQGVLAVLCALMRSSPEGNFFYRVLQITALPFVRLSRLLAPRQVLDRHLPWVAFFLLLLLWSLVTFFKIRWCLQVGMHLCR